MDLAKKYKNIEKNQTHLPNSSLHRSSMLAELQTLAAALIKSEKRIVKLKAGHKDKGRELKDIIE
jgi:hypothetical protein